MGRLESRCRGWQRGRVDAFAHRVVDVQVAHSVKRDCPDGVVVLNRLGGRHLRATVALEQFIDDLRNLTVLPCHQKCLAGELRVAEEKIAAFLGPIRIGHQETRGQVVGQVVGGRIGFDGHRGREMRPVGIACGIIGADGHLCGVERVDLAGRCPTAGCSRIATSA